MAAPVTEFARIALKPGIDANSDGYKALEKMSLTAVSQPGAQRVYWGHGIEDPSKVWQFLDWDTVDDHLRFQKSEAYGPLLSSLEPIVDSSNTFIKHVSLSPFPPTSVLQSGATEVLTMFFPSDISAADKAAATSQLEEFNEKALKGWPDFKGVSYGWSVESDVPVIGEDGKTGSLLTAFLGWPSVEAHMKFRETTQFKDNIPLLRTMPNMTKIGVFHVSCKSVAAPAGSAS